MKTFTVKLASRTPILMNRFSFGKKADMISVSDTDALADAVRTKKIAEDATYRNTEGQLVIPADNLYRAFITAGKKVKKGKSNFSTVVAGAVVITEDLLLTNAEGTPSRNSSRTFAVARTPQPKVASQSSALVWIAGTAR